MLPEEGADEMEIGGDIYSFNFPINGIALSPDKLQLHYSSIGRKHYLQSLICIAKLKYMF